MPKLISGWFASLVNRAVVFVVAGIVLSALVVVLVSSLVSRSELEAQARQQVSTIADLVADDLDAKLIQRRHILARVGQNLTMSEQAFQSRARVVLGQKVTLQQLFNGLFLFDAFGSALASLPESYQSLGGSVAHRDYFQDTSSLLTPVISAPFLSHYENKPAIMMTAPVFDHRQRFIGILGGGVLLESENFIMKESSGIEVGQTGYVTVATRSGTVLTHGRTGESMVPVQIENETVRDAMAGFEGTRRTRNAAGDETIMAVRQLSQVPWYVAVVWPLEEAYAPVQRLTDSFVLVLLGVLLIMLPLALVVFRRLMAPLKLLGAQISDRHLGIRTRPVDELGGSEIRQVAETFNTVMEERDEVLASLAEREAYFRSLTHSAPIGIVQTDVLGRIEFANPAFEQIVGISSRDLQQSPLIEGVYEEDRPGAIESWREALKNRKVFRDRLRLKSLNGELSWADVMTAVIETGQKTLGTITVVRDITHQLEVENQLAEEQARADSILGVLQEGVLMVDLCGAIRYANRAALDFMGAPEVGEHENFFDHVTIVDTKRTWTAEEFLQGEDVANHSATLTNAQQQSYDIDLTVLHLRPDSARHRVVFVIRDDSERRREEERLSWQATHDSLTGLLNRRAFSASLIRCMTEMSSRSNASVLMLIDLDHFKPVNDQGGHLLGDDLLVRLSEVLMNTVRQSDSVARLGGDEFGIILPACGMARAEALAEEIRRGMESIRVEQDGRTFGVTASIGLTAMAFSDSSPRQVLARADEGTYAAKAQGRNQAVVVPLPPQG